MQLARVHFILFAGISLLGVSVLSSLQARIGNGTPIEENEYPSVVSFRVEFPDGKTYRSNGVIVGDNTLMTVGHAFPKEGIYKIILDHVDAKRVLVSEPQNKSNAVVESRFFTDYDSQVTASAPRDHGKTKDVGVVVFPKGTFKPESVASFRLQDLSVGDSLTGVSYAPTKVVLDEALRVTEVKDWNRAKGGFNVQAIADDKSVEVSLTQRDKLNSDAFITQGDSGGVFFDSDGRIASLIAANYRRTNGIVNIGVNPRHEMFHGVYRRASENGAQGLEPLLPHDEGVKIVIRQVDSALNPKSCPPNSD